MGAKGVSTSIPNTAVRKWLVASLLALSGAATHAQPAIPGYPNNVLAYDPREVGRLPSYCKYTQSFRERVPGGDNPAQIAQWLAVMGDVFNHMHHYCWGLMKLNRALHLARGKHARDFFFNDAITEIDYVLNRSSEDFVLRPELLTKKGQSLIMLGRGPLAVIELERAIELKPDYWPPYVQLADYYSQIGDTAKAREMIERALGFAPESKTLRSKLDELNPPATTGGKR